LEDCEELSNGFEPDKTFDREPKFVGFRLELDEDEDEVD
jgi:hypothetical protein